MTTSEEDPAPRAGGLDRRSFLAGLGAAGAALPLLPALAHAATGRGARAASWSNPAVGEITSGYMTPERPEHAGTDVANSQGTAIRAAAAGTVAAVRTDSYPGDTSEGLLPGRTGNGVIIDHGGGTRTYYGHLLSASVSKGDEVSAGEQIAEMGTTGNSTGPHLHFEVHVDGSTTDPVPFLADRGVELGSGTEGGSWPAVRPGDEGKTVEVVQHLLNQHGSSLEADGRFGAVSVAAAEEFQRSRGLVADGVIAAVTWPELVVAVEEGSSGAAVEGAQVALGQHGYRLAVDGDFSGATAEAVRSFQSSAGLVVDALIGPITWAALV